MWHDLRFGFRQMRLRPGFHAVLILTFALGIGLNTALFTVVNALLLRALPGYQTDRLVTIWQRHGPLDRDHSVNGDTVRLWRARATSFERIEAGAFDKFNLSGVDIPEVVPAADVTAGYFQLYRAQALRGRTFLPGDDSPGRNHVAVLDHALWKRKFGGDPKVVGSTLHLDRKAYLVVGVMPPEFHPLGPGTVSLYLPLAMDELAAWDFWTVARLAPGISLERARAEMAAVTDPARKGFEAHVVPLREMAQRGIRGGVLSLFAAVAVVLLIASANTANLLLARVSFRAREFAMRLTLGANPWRLARQLITEGLTVAAAGGIIGAILGDWGLRLLIRSNPRVLPRLEEVSIDSRVIAFAAGVTLLSALLATLSPVLSLVRHDLDPLFRPGGRGNALVVSEIALTFVLVSASLLLLQSFRRLAHGELGYDHRNLLSLDISSPAPPDSDGAALPELYRRIVARLQALPGVRAVELATHPPIGGVGITFPVLVAGRPTPAPETPEAHTSIVSPGYFAALRIPIRRGRAFTVEDRRGSLPTVIVNDAIARRFFSGADPVGQKLLINTFDPNITTLGQPKPREIVGVVGDVKEESLKDPAPLQIYVPLDQNPISFVSILIRTAGDPAALTLAAQREIAREDKDLPASDVRPMEAKISATLAAPRQTTALFGGFAALALVLAAMGVYGVLSYAVTRRAREIGIRMALGASPGGVLGLVLGQSLRHAAWGIAIGWALVFTGERWFESRLFGIRVTDPLTLVAVSLGILGLATAAALVPARSAARVDPMAVVRTE
jgi:putative ABC transport system permease protein